MSNLQDEYIEFINGANMSSTDFAHPLTGSLPLTVDSPVRGSWWDLFLFSYPDWHWAQGRVLDGVWKWECYSF